MKLRQKRIKMIGIAASILALVLAYQNCAEYRLGLEQPVTKASAKGDFCSLPAIDDRTTVNIIFVVDMSGSNIRTLNSTSTGYNAVGTDQAGERFQIIEDFLSTECAQRNSQNRFSIIGFSSAVLTSQGSVCNSSLLATAGSTALNGQLAYLRQVQTTEMTDIPNPDQMRSTYYEEGLGCAQEIVEDAISEMTPEEAKKSGFHVMFLSDGIPQSTSGGNLTDLTPILSLVDDMVNTGKSAAYLAVQPILYGSEALGTEREFGEEIMREIANRGTTVAESVDNPEAINFCSLLDANQRTPYTVTDFGIVNLTAHLRKGQLMIDSDIDGIPDSEEVARGFDPQKTRTGINGNQLVDGFCKTDAADCPVYNSCSSANALGLTSCDTAFFTLTDGLDTDRDGLPDLVEILKGTLPNSADQNNDLDGDSVINLLEVLKGSDPNSWDRNLDSKLRLQYKHSITSVASPNCPASQQSWNFEVDYLPLLPTLATNNTDAISQNISFVNHAAGENVIFVYYVIRQANEQENAPGELYGQFIKVGQFERVNFDRFEKLGVINGTFESL